MLPHLLQVLVVLCSISPAPAATAKVSARPQPLFQLLTALFQLVKATLCIPEVATTLTLGISRIIQLEHPAR